MPRGVTAVKALRAAGVNVAAGADNLQDPFNPVGRGDPLETAGLMIMTAHVLPADALAHGHAGPLVRRWALRPSEDHVAVRGVLDPRGDRIRPGRSPCGAPRLAFGNRAFTRSRLSGRGLCPTLRRDGDQTMAGWPAGER